MADLGAASSTSWRALASATLPGARAAHSAALVELPDGAARFVAIFGGWDGHTGLAQLVLLDVSSPSREGSGGAAAPPPRWFAPPLARGEAPVARNNHAAFAHGGRLYIHAGHNGSTWLADLWEIDLAPLVAPRAADGLAFARGAAPLPSVRSFFGISGAASAAASGIDRSDGGSGSSESLRSALALEAGALSALAPSAGVPLPALAWTQPPTAGTAPSPRACHSVAVAGDRALVFGG
jgi:hypothetical protein